jgi:uncharacterized protein (DUF1684 family)
MPELTTRFPRTAFPVLDLLDWKRRVFAAYADVRASSDRQEAWRRWRRVRDELFAGHPQSPLGEDVRASFAGVPYADYQAAMAVEATLEGADGAVREIGTSTGQTIRFRHFADAHFELLGGGRSLPVYWLEGYGGGVFVPFADATNGSATYGGGRYLLDTVKGADLGVTDGGLVLDFNFAYNPSCAYDPRWTCPLPPPESRLDCEVQAGELDPAAGRSA